VILRGSENETDERVQEGTGSGGRILAAVVLIEDMVDEIE
jgi:hypothetical protein